MTNSYIKYVGIDVSHHNIGIDWGKIEREEYKFAIIRMGYGSDYPGKKADGGQDDNEFENNIKGVIENNIPFAVYLYSYATHIKKDEEEGMDGAVESEVEHAKRLLETIPEGKKPFAVYYSLAESKTKNAVLQAGKDSLTSFAEYFCEKISEMGYRSGIYIKNSALQEDKFNLQAFYEESKKKFRASLWIGDNSKTSPYIGIPYDIWHFGHEKINNFGLDVTNKKFYKSIILGD